MRPSGWRITLARAEARAANPPYGTVISGLIQ
jgi:hypothetical protein